MAARVAAVRWMAAWTTSAPEEDALDEGLVEAVDVGVRYVGCGVVLEHLAVGGHEEGSCAAGGVDDAHISQGLDVGPIGARPSVGREGQARQDGGRGYAGVEGGEELPVGDEDG